MRPASVFDISALHTLIESAYRGDSAKQGWTHEADLLGGQRTDREALAEIVADPKQTLLVAEQDDAITGCVLVKDLGVRDGAPIAYLGMLTVRPDLQAAGLGRALLAAAEAHARSIGAEIMEMTVIKSRTELIAWYERRGYTSTGREEPFPLDDPRFGLPKTLDLVFMVMAKRLA